MRLRAPKARGFAATLHPASKSERPDFRPAISCTPSRRDSQTSLRSVSGSCGSRTRLFGLKGRCPQPIDERAVASAHLPRSWGIGNARTFYAVGREVLEPSSAAFQAAATPSQLPAQ